MSEEALDTSTFISGEADNGDAPAVDPVIDPVPADSPEGEVIEHGDDGKPLSKTQIRFNEITRARREEERRANQAERDAKYWRDVAEGRAQSPARTPQDEGAKAPNPDDYPLGDMDQKYLTDLVDYRVEQGVSRGLDKFQTSMSEREQRQASERAWEAKFASARSKFADFDAVIAPKDEAGAVRWPLSDDAGKAIQESDVAGELLYHLASNPEEAHRIYGLSPHSQLREIGKIEERLEKAEVKPAKTSTDAPKPPNGQARGAGGQFSPSPETDDFKQFEASYAAKW